MAELENTKKLAGQLGLEAMRMQTLAHDMSTMGFEATAKRLDADSVVLIKMQNRLMAALRADGVSLNG